MDLHPAHLAWATKSIVLSLDQLYIVLDKVDSELRSETLEDAWRSLMQRDIDFTDARPSDVIKDLLPPCNYPFFRQRCEQLVGGGMSSLFLTYSVIAWSLNEWYCLGNIDGIAAGVDRLSVDVMRLTQTVDECNDPRKKAFLIRLLTKITAARDSFESRTQTNRETYVRLCEEIVEPLLALNGRVNPL